MRILHQNKMRDDVRTAAAPLMEWWRKGKQSLLGDKTEAADELDAFFIAMTTGWGTDEATILGMAEKVESQDAWVAVQLEFKQRGYDHKGSLPARLKTKLNRVG